jgi:hypothetical protein
MIAGHHDFITVFIESVKVEMVRLGPRLQRLAIHLTFNSKELSYALASFPNTCNPMLIVSPNTSAKRTAFTIVERENSPVLDGSEDLFNRKNLKTLIRILDYADRLVDGHSRTPYDLYMRILTHGVLSSTSDLLQLFVTRGTDVEVPVDVVMVIMIVLDPNFWMDTDFLETMSRCSFVLT